MSFGYTVIGSREQVAEQLAAINAANAEGTRDSLLNGVIDLLAEHVGMSELHGYGSGIRFRQQYVIHFAGHAGPQSPFRLEIKTEDPYVPVTDAVPALTEAGEAALDAETDPDDDED